MFRLPEFTLPANALRALAILGAGLLPAACSPGSAPGGETEIVFEDTIPCADCPGIIMQMRFDTAAHTYTRNMTYLEANEDGGDAEFSNSGSYTTERGYKNDESAVLYVLEAAPSGGEQVFLASGDSTITALDGNREMIQSGLNFTLRKKE